MRGNNIAPSIQMSNIKGVKRLILIVDPIGGATHHWESARLHTGPTNGYTLSYVTVVQQYHGAIYTPHRGAGGFQLLRFSAAKDRIVDEEIDYLEYCDDTRSQQQPHVSAEVTWTQDQPAAVLVYNTYLYTLCVQPLVVRMWTFGNMCTVGLHVRRTHAHSRTHKHAHTDMW